MTSQSSVSALDAAPPEALATLAARPGFAAAMRNSILAPLALLDEDPRFFRCIGDIPTYALGVLALHLHATDRLYHRGLQEMARGLFSAGRASAILARMQAARLIAPRDAFQSGRQRRYVPAPDMIRAFRVCYRIELQSLALIDDRAGRLVETYEVNGVFDDIVTFLAGRHLTTPTLDQDLVDPLGGVGRRSMGLFLAYALAETAFSKGLSRAEGEIEINMTTLAKRLGVSRTHARRILKMLEAAGLVIMGRSASQITLTPAFARGLETYFLGMFGILLAAVGLYEA